MHVDESNVGFELLDDRECVFAILGLARDFDVRLFSQDQAQARAHERVIVH